MAVQHIMYLTLVRINGNFNDEFKLAQHGHNELPFPMYLLAVLPLLFPCDVET